jgi:O-Antigen ligase
MKSVDIRIEPQSSHGTLKAINARVALVLFFVVHIPLALLMREYHEIATIHAIATLVIGLWWAASRSQPYMAMYVSAYITGAEVLWRMVGADVFWEFGKYAVAAVLIVAILRRGDLKPQTPMLLYFLLLLPSTAMVLANNDFSAARRDVSFNLSGPFSLMLSAWFFSRLKLSRNHVHSLFAVLMGPFLGIATVALSNTLNARSIQFGNESNLVTSGGFGPNQVSSMLGLGALLCFVSQLDGSVGKGLRLIMLGLLLLFGTQSALTFSRGGLFMAFVSGMIASLMLMRSRRARIRLIVIGLFLFVIGGYVVLPRLETFTKGSIVTRFQNTAPTGRDAIVAEDLRTWEEHPIFGAGPGQAKFRHGTFNRVITAHTEFSRLLAEHGVLGLAALALLLSSAALVIKRASSTDERVVRTLLISWSFLFMLGDAMRLVAPAFLMGLAFATLFPEAIRIKEQRRMKLKSYFQTREIQTPVPLRIHP